MTVTTTVENGKTTKVESSFTPVGGVRVEVKATVPSPYTYATGGIIGVIGSGTAPPPVFDRVAHAHTLTADYINSDQFAKAMKTAEVESRKAHEESVKPTVKLSSLVEPPEVAAGRRAVRDAEDAVEAAQKQLKQVYDRFGYTTYDA